MKYQLSIIQYPSGRFGFVGSVPKDLAVRHRDNRTLTNEEFERYRCASNPSMILRSENYVVPVFNTYDDAVNFALECGIDLRGAS